MLDQLITGPITQGEFESIFGALKKAVIERAMSAEMNEHLGYKHGEPKPAGQSNQRNQRNGISGKTVITDDYCSLGRDERRRAQDYFDRAYGMYLENEEP